MDCFRRGWVAVVLEDGAFSGAWTAPTFDEVRARCDGADAIGVDIPIGLEGAPRRLADEAAKAFLRPRGSVVFRTYPEWLYRVAEALPYRERYAEARRRCRELGWPVVSSQSFALGARILELVPWTDDSRLLEVHPEISFRELAGRDLGEKKGWNGLMARRRVLREGGIELPEILPEAVRVPADDVLDAAVAAWTACRYADRAARPLPGGHPRGVPGAIWR